MFAQWQWKYQLFVKDLSPFSWEPVFADMFISVENPEWTKLEPRTNFFPEFQSGYEH